MGVVYFSQNLTSELENWKNLSLVIQSCLNLEIFSYGMETNFS